MYLSKLGKSRAFTLIELAITLLIAGIIAGIAIFAYQSLQRNVAAGEAAALADRVVMVQTLVARDWGTFSPYGNDLKQVGGDVIFVEHPGASTKKDEVSIAVSNRGYLGIAIMGGDDQCHRYYVDSVLGRGVKTEVTGLPTSARCTGAISLPSGQTATESYTIGGTVKNSN